ncbi:hypothetical protein GCM10010420_55580 [Streptomyces glaucosporus]|uniref:Uncharacterized protein n=1 Tax=Streptomyces glaucosporus TaxID=284044 RepID=A0ABN3J192_9ACTN
MTDVTIPPTPPPQTDPAPAPASSASVVEQAPPSTAASAEAGHTPGGWPVVPLALSGANTTVGAVSAAALAAGPVAAAVAATVAVVLGTAAATRTRRPGSEREARRAGHRTASAVPRQGSGGTSTRSGRTGRLRRGNGSSTRAVAGHRIPAPSVSAGKATGRGRSGTGSARRSPAGRGGLVDRARQIRALRDGQRAGAPPRAQQRAQTTAARRAVADARRAQGPAARTAARLSAGGRGGRMLARALDRARTARDRAVGRGRAVRDARTASAVAARRAALRRAPLRRAARWALWRSAACFHGRRLLAALLAAPLGLVGLLSTPLGRRLGWRWLMYPGRRLYRHLVGRARHERAQRDAAIRDRLAAEEAAADAAAEKDPNEVGDRVQRPAHLRPTHPNNRVEVVSVSGFRFEEAAAEMENAARTYEPDGAMEILAMVENLPAALTSMANTFRILAERADEEFPLEKEVAAGFEDIYAALVAAIDKAEDLGPLFRQVHEPDIARHEDPRNGTEAEKGWNV